MKLRRGVAQVHGDLERAARLDVGQRLVDRDISTVALRRGRQVRRRLRQDNARLGHADHMHALHRRGRDQHRRRVGVADVLARGDHQAARQEHRVLAGIEHARQDGVDRAVRLAGADRDLMKRRDRVVVEVAGLVVASGSSLAPRRPATRHGHRRRRRRRADRDGIKQRQRPPRVAVRRPRHGRRTSSAISVRAKAAAGVAKRASVGSPVSAPSAQPLEA